LATTSKLTGSNGCYGHSGNGEYGSSGGNHLYAGKSSGTSDYRSRLTFPAMSSLEEVGADRIRITRMTLYIRRNESGSAAAITAGCSSSSAWGAAIEASASGSIANSTGDYQTVDLTALADAVTGYGSKWYLHIFGSAPRVRFDGTGKAKKPYIEVTWERVAATITGDRDSAELGSQTVTFTIAPEVEGETHTLTYSLGDSAGTIAERAGNTIAWTPPLSLASEILYDTAAPAQVRMTAYDSGGNIQRTETYYQTVTVPASVKPAITSAGISAVNALSGYLLAGHTSLKIAPTIDMTGAYGATIAGLSAEIGGQRIEWTSLTESEPGIFTAAAAQTELLAEGTVSVIVTATDSRGREATSTANDLVRPYSPPVITDFDVFRWEPFYDEDEEEAGYMRSDVGSYAAVTLMAEAASVKPAGTQLNKLRYTVTGENNDTGEIITGADVSGDFLDDDGCMADSGRRIQIIFDMDIFPQNFDGGEAWTFTVTVTDSAGSTARSYSAIAPGHAAFSLSPDKHGAAVGMIATGTKDDPKFEVAEGYESRFYGPVFDRHGAEITGGVSDIKLAGDLTAEISVPNKTNTDTVIFTAELPGLYLACISERWGGKSTGYRSLALLDGAGTMYSRIRQAAGGSEEIQQSLCSIIPLAPGGSIVRRAYQDSGSALKFVERSYQVARIGG